MATGDSLYNAQWATLHKYKHDKEKYYVALTRDKPVFTCVEYRKKLNNCRVCSCFDCVQPRILDLTAGRSSRISKR